MGKSMKQMHAEAKAARAPTVAEFIDVSPVETESFQAEEKRRLARVEFDALDAELHSGFGDYLEKRAELGDDSSAAMLSAMVSELVQLQREFGFKCYHETLEEIY